jgi:arylsulfatase A-like enzyme
LVEETKALGVFDNTYWIVSSDHGYNLGNHRIPSNKFLLYNHATRIPMVVHGPGIKPGKNPVLGTNVDYAPTFMAMAGLATPPTMDGRSL